MLLAMRLDEKPDEFKLVKQEAYFHNNWFTAENIDQAIESIKKDFLDHSKLQKWAESYKIPDSNTAKRVGLIMAGNIPLVGFHDLICVFVAGHISVIKLSSKDELLLKFIIGLMIEIDPEIADLIRIVDRLPEIDSVIATGSNNSYRYFEYYFSKIPHILRKNRNSVAILTGDESLDDMNSLISDIQSYFGLGCRNVSKIFVPKGYDFGELLGMLNKNEDLKMHNKYMNNYEYNLAVALINNDDILQGDSILLKKDPSYISRLAVVNYEEYNKLFEVVDRLNVDKDLIQLIATHTGDLTGMDIEFKFGRAQNPQLWDYADGVDTMSFLGGI